MIGGLNIFVDRVVWYFDLGVPDAPLVGGLNIFTNKILGLLI